MNRISFPGIEWLLDRILIAVSLLAISSLIIEYGFYISPKLQFRLELLDVLIIWYFAAHSVAKYFLAGDKREYLRSRWFDVILIALIFLETAFLFGIVGGASFADFFEGRNISQIVKFYLIGFQIFIVLSLFSKGARLNKYLARLSLHPAKILMGSFLLIIIIGTLLLKLPRAVSAGCQLSWLDALFTSTSATCVTGLIVVDTGLHFSQMGQIIILALIQIGGLGLMTYASFFALVLGRKISLREKSMMREVLNYDQSGILPKLLTTTIIFTVGIEIVGAILLFIGFGDGLPTGERIYTSIFHSVSAFCNAGFSLYSHSFIGLRQNHVILGVISLLIILGGIGFPVILNIFSQKMKRPLGVGKGLGVQTRLVLWMTAVLLISGAVFIFVAEQNNFSESLGLCDKIINAFFQSVTVRTAGFNTLDIAQFGLPALLLLMMFMFIGASPGSTAGGVKTTTVAIIFAGIASTLRGRERIELFRKNISAEVFKKSVVIVFLSLGIIFLTILLLTMIEKFDIMDISFEVFSAFGTVGLSRGITPFLSQPGKFVIILLMFFGRLGALTISLAIASPRESSHYQYPTENVMVG